MLPFEDRFTRQRQLPEVGHEGQLRLQRAQLQVERLLGWEVEVEYLRRAGVQQLTVGSPAQDTANTTDATTDELAFASTKARAFAHGSLRALARLRNTLRLGS